MNPTLSAEVLWEVSRVSCSFRIFQETAFGKNTRRERKPLVDRRRIGHQTVKRNKGGNRGKHREKAIENYPGRHRQQPIVVHLLVHPPKNGCQAPFWAEKSGAIESMI